MVHILIPMPSVLGSAKASQKCVIVLAFGLVRISLRLCMCFDVCIFFPVAVAFFLFRWIEILVDEHCVYMFMLHTSLNTGHISSFRSSIYLLSLKMPDVLTATTTTLTHTHTTSQCRYVDKWQVCNLQNAFVVCLYRYRNEMKRDSREMFPFYRSRFAFPSLSLHLSLSVPFKISYTFDSVWFASVYYG